MPKRSAEYPFSRPPWETGYRIPDKDFPELGSPGKPIPGAPATKANDRKNVLPVGGTKYSNAVLPGHGHRSKSQTHQKTIIGKDVGKGCNRWSEKRNLVQKVPQMGSESEFPELNPLSPEQKEKNEQEAVRKWIGITPKIGKAEGWVEGKSEGLLGSGEGYTWMFNKTRSRLQELYHEKEDEEGNEVVSLPSKPCWWYTMGEPGGFDPKTGKSG